ncbi:MAG: Gx transporter family protein [Treponema sp.]|nr:Gx transporter family protein [Treponema sp.]
MTAQPGKGGSTAALLGGFCLFLSTLEYMVPKPLPFLRIGLANVPIMLGLDILSFKYLAILVLIKVLGQALITGTLVSYIALFSLAGTCSSAAIMYLLRRLLGPQRISFIGISVIGALVSNFSQLVLARFFVFGEGIRFLIPPFLAVGLITGITLGIFCETFTARSRWYQTRI